MGFCFVYICLWQVVSLSTLVAWCLWQGGPSTLLAGPLTHGTLVTVYSNCMTWVSGVIADEFNVVLCVS